MKKFLKKLMFWKKEKSQVEKPKEKKLRCDIRLTDGRLITIEGYYVDAEDMSARMAYLMGKDGCIHAKLLNRSKHVVLRAENIVEATVVELEDESHEG